MIRTIAATVALLAGPALSVGAAERATAQTLARPAELRVLDADSTGPVTLTVDGQTLTTGPGTASSYVHLPDGPMVVHVRLVGGSVDKTFTAADGYTTVVVSGPDASAIAAVADVFPVVRAGQAAVRLLDASIDEPTAVLTADGRVLTGSVGPGIATGYVAVPAGYQHLLAVRSGGQAELGVDADLGDGTVTTMVVFGSGETPVRAAILPDAVQPADRSGPNVRINTAVPAGGDPTPWSHTGLGLAVATMVLLLCRRRASGTIAIALIMAGCTPAASPLQQATLTPAPSVPGPFGSAPSTTTPSPSRARATPVALSIPALGVTVNLQDRELASAADLWRTLDQRSVAWLHDPAPEPPGPAGRVIVAGHGNPGAIFAKLERLRPGDIIAVTLSDRRTKQFIVATVSQYPKGNVPVFAATADDEVDVVTCTGPPGPGGLRLTNLVARAWVDQAGGGQ